jgi:hypothetical protein
MEPPPQTGAQAPSNFGCQTGRTATTATITAVGKGGAKLQSVPISAAVVAVLWSGSASAATDIKAEALRHACNWSDASGGMLLGQVGIPFQLRTTMVAPIVLVLPNPLVVLISVQAASAMIVVVGSADYSSSQSPSWPTLVAASSSNGGGVRHIPSQQPRYGRLCCVRLRVRRWRLCAIVVVPVLFTACGRSAGLTCMCSLRPLKEIAWLYSVGSGGTRAMQALN